MNQYIRIILFVIFFCTPFVPGMAQTGRFYSMESGLSSSLVNKLLQDSRGFVWIATEYGLNRFDGIRFTNYKHIPGDSTSIKNNYVHTLFEDSRLIWIIIGAAFDFFDGMSARLLKVSSPIGKELDSLADDITFGFAPSAIVFSQLSVMDYPAFLEPTRQFLPFIAFVMAAFSALRLAKFNLDERQTTSFIGMPTPANALFWGSLIATQTQWLESSPWMVFVLILLLALCCWLLVAELPMFALKFKQWGWKGNEIKYSFIIL